MSARPISVSALFVVRDEAANIERAVAGVLGLVDEVVVVDTGSVDATAVLAKAAGARVLQSPWLGYGPTKNFGASACAHDWVLSLDADEVPDESLSAALRATAPTEGTVYGVRRVTNFCGHWVRHGAWGRDVVWRLYDRRAAAWDAAEVHETLVPQAGGARVTLPGELLHYSYPDLASHDRKVAHYLELGVGAIVAAGRRPNSVKRYVAPAWRAFRSYVLQSGWRDGWAGRELALRDFRMVREKYRRAAARMR